MEEYAMNDSYEKLRERLDMFPQGFPKTESGVEMEILKHLFNPEEAEIMLFVRTYPEPASAVAERMRQDEKELGEKLYDMSKKGLILRFRVSDEEVYYFLSPWMVGIWEFQVKNLTDENIKLYERYFEEGIVPSRKNIKTAGFRVIPVEQRIQDNANVEPYEKVSEIIESSTRFAVADCICRKEAQMFGKGCDKLMEGCMMFDMAADYYIENGIGREITKEEARQVLAKTEDDGLVHHSSNHLGKKLFICNCCSCCCKALAHITKYNNPNQIAKSNYYAVVNKEECTACETCVDRCQVGAIHMEDDIALINAATCIGCGLCVSTCPTECISLIHRSPKDASFIFADGDELLQSLAAEKNRPFPFE
jgi:electron transport complex protein RnfB